MSWEFRSGGKTLVGSWNCLECFDYDSGESLREPGDGGDAIRARAVEHLRGTGHRVSFGVGTRETLIPLATEVPGGG
jgi:hypothetical protein